jgi:thymidylate synthase (FAD)
MTNEFPIVELIARPQFIQLPERLGQPREDQLQGCDAAKLIETAGRTCYDSFGKGRNSGEYAQHIMEVGHGSVLEHAQYTFFLSGISRGLTHELVRHRIGVAISQRSTRYVDEDDSPWILHPLLEKYFSGDPLYASRKMDAIDACRNLYTYVVRVVQEGLVRDGVDNLTARKQARGAARGFLGNALMTEMVWSANVRALRNVIEQRAHPAADQEIRRMAMKLWRIMVEELPEYFSDYRVIECRDGGEALETDRRKV